MAAGPNGPTGALVLRNVEVDSGCECDHATHQCPNMVEPHAEEAITKPSLVTPIAVLVITE